MSRIDYVSAIGILSRELARSKDRESKIKEILEEARGTPLNAFTRAQEIVMDLCDDKDFIREYIASQNHALNDDASIKIIKFAVTKYLIRNYKKKQATSAQES